MKEITKPYYVLLTGGKNNAGDYLIKHRAIKLFKRLRLDRDIVDVDAWKDRDADMLSLMNKSEAVILTGGPALRSNMYPNIYKALGNIDDITVPILAMAIGWRSFPGEWYQTHSYKFTHESTKLLNRIESSGYHSSVRDFHSLNVLLQLGYKSFKMTGCTALYDLDTLSQSQSFDKRTGENEDVSVIAFSLGVSFIQNEAHEKSMKNLILSLNEKYGQNRFIVVFHHSLQKDKFEKAYSINSKFLEAHQKFSEWLSNHKIEYQDISGSANNLINFYKGVDLHIGYRVHAHIFMSSLAKRSILIAEDGRGRALKDVLNGLVLDNEYSNVSTISKTSADIWFRLLRKFNIHQKSASANSNLREDLMKNLSYEEETDYSRVRNNFSLIRNHFDQMKKFILQLP